MGDSCNLKEGSLESHTPPISTISLEDRLKAAARTGDTDILYSLINEDPNLLKNIDVVPFVDTPLHIAASEGQINFAMEIMMLKPSFSRKLNKDGFTPLHLALQHQKKDVVFRMIDVDADLVRARGRHGETALHFAARHGNLLLLSLFLRTCPKSIQDVTTKRETALHITVQNKKFGALDFLVANLRKAVNENSNIQETEILNKGDENMDTALHIAVRTNQHQMVRLLLDCGGVKKKLKNSQGQLPADLLQSETPENKSNREAIRKMLSAAGVLVASETSRQETNGMLFTDNTHETSNEDLEGQTPKPNNPTDYSWSKVSFLDRVMINFSRINSNMPSDLRNMVLVVLVLIATATYQGVLSPPERRWKDNFKSITTDSSANKTEEAMFTFGFILYQIINTVALFFSTSIISFLMPSLYFGVILRVPIWLFFCCYITGIVITMPYPTRKTIPAANFLLLIAASGLLLPTVFGLISSRVKRSLTKGIVNKYMN